MRNSQLILTGLMLLLAGSAFGQQYTTGIVPSVIKNDFASSYPNAEDVEWEREGDLYKVEFESSDKVDHEIWYDGNSDIVREEVEITEAELPAAVLTAIAASFGGYSIDDVERITTTDGESYLVELEALLKEDWEVTFSSDGRLLAKAED